MCQALWQMLPQRYMESFNKNPSPFWHMCCMKSDPQDPYELCQRSELHFLTQKLRFIRELKTTQSIHTYAQSVTIASAILTGFSLLRCVGISWNEMTRTWWSAQIQKKSLWQSKCWVAYALFFHRQSDSRKREQPLQIRKWECKYFPTIFLRKVVR